MTDIRSALDSALADSEAMAKKTQNLVPTAIYENINKWNFGGYGWTSPVNLFLTAAWYKWLNPEQDVCRIWSQHHDKTRIEGGFAIRSNDENYTVPLVNKARIAQGFCSPNSGMQGSRAIEKMRSAERINRNEAIEQSVKFDMALFQNIMNDINDCSSDEAHQCFCYLLSIGLKIRKGRETEQNKLLSLSGKSGKSFTDLLKFADDISDPQFIKLLVVSLMTPFVLNTHKSLILEGVEGHKTAADSQSKAPGDFWFNNQDGVAEVGVEVKDKTKTIGFEILGAIENRKKNNSGMKYYFAVSAAKIAVKEYVAKDRLWAEYINRLRDDFDIAVLPLSVYDLVALASFNGASVTDVMSDLNKHLVTAIDLKKETLKQWLSFYS
ncbi:hypothetical protein [Endozoicomonas lisbonensis]|uniref:Restriction endonuclease n=1 Tax=Endozoicomonas lisbonensis TaxID=3120522 RepID=A0ABV2SES7_9GAMM